MYVAIYIDDSTFPQYYGRLTALQATDGGMISHLSMGLERLKILLRHGGKVE